MFGEKTFSDVLLQESRYCEFDHCNRHFENSSHGTPLEHARINFILICFPEGFRY